MKRRTLKVMLSAVLLSLVISIPAQSAPRYEEGESDQQIRIFLPKIVLGAIQEYIRIEDPIDVEGKNLNYTRESASVVDCFTHPDGHCRLWFGTATLPIAEPQCNIVRVGGSTPTDPDVANVFYEFGDGGLTYLPNAEDSNEPIGSWLWTVEAIAQVNDMIQHYRDIGQDAMADQIEALTDQSVLVVQLNRRHGIYYNVPTSESNLLANNNYEDFSLECYR